MSGFSSPVVLIALALIVSYGIYTLSQVGRREPALPPGPPTVPILGNLHQIPLTGFHKKTLEWAQKYGPIYSVKLGPGTLIVLTSKKAIHDLLDKRSAIYSDRPKDYIGDIITGGEKLEHMHYNDLWRAQRKIATQSVAPRVLDTKVAPLQEAENVLLLQDLLHDPASFSSHIQRATVSVANTLVWGHRASSSSTFWGRTPWLSLEGFSECFELGANPPLEQFPFLKLIPERFAPWVRRARVPNAAMRRTWGEARRRVEERRARGDRRMGALFDQIAEGELRADVPLTESQVNHFLGTMVEGGAETSSSAMLTSVLFLALHREVQIKAQRELDAVCGPERIPTWGDFATLPYINCIVKEAMRIRPVGPLGVPHCATRDDWYEGMFIPKGSIALLPAWTVHRLESNGYKNPDAYDPDRWIGQTRTAAELAGIADYENRDEEHHYSYGAGRRVCPGMHMAERTMWRMTAKILWAFDIIPVDVDPDNYDEGIIHRPNPYKVEFRPRSEAHVKTIEREVGPALEFLKQFE
ncbi:cytochrome P450 [Macrophomina phaseolina]|uniref:Cytochrome P450 n=1 Tax=Macrophomina phaseolina TaxID=35725 RepID=A0ABQ8GML2_9PEZI|nr:cytochrome P450 [Macrophomina phaseolina]